MGTDLFWARCVLSRLLLGTRISLSIGLISVFISLIIGIIIGSLGGFYGGNIDKAVMWVINVTWSIPTLLLVIAISVALGKDSGKSLSLLGWTMWVEVARIVRGQVSIRTVSYVIATQVLGFSSFRTLFGHILPNAFGPLAVITASNFAAAILIESGLSFLGIGVQPPIPSGVIMIKDRLIISGHGKTLFGTDSRCSNHDFSEFFYDYWQQFEDRYDPQKADHHSFTRLASNFK